MNLRGSGVQGNSQWEAMAIDMLFSTLKSYLMFNPSVHLSLRVCTSGINAAIVQVFKLSLLSISSGTVNTRVVYP